MRKTIERVLSWNAGEGRRRVALALVALTAAAVPLCGCGGKGPGTAGNEAPGSGQAAARHEPSVASRGIKGESSTEVVTGARLSAGDCGRLAGLAGRRLGRPLSRRSDPRPPASSCKLTGHGTTVEVYLDSGFAAHRRYYNRIEETVQFGETDPTKDPHPVPHVGERAIDNSAANWIPGLGSLLAVRGSRWLTVTIAVAGRPNRQLRGDAASLARLGFRLTAG